MATRRPDIKMTMRYAHLSTEFAKEEIQLIAGLASMKKEKDKREGEGTARKVSQIQDPK